jgi:hypothetical protein
MLSLTRSLRQPDDDIMAPADSAEYSRATRVRIALADAAADVSDVSRELVDPRRDQDRERGGLVQAVAVLVARAEQLQLLAVAAERRQGATWEVIAEFLGTSRQAAHAKYAAGVAALNLAIVRYWLETSNGGCPARPPIPGGCYDPAETARRLDKWIDPKLYEPVSHSLRSMTADEHSDMIRAAAGLIDDMRAQEADVVEIRDLEMGLAERKIELYERMLARQAFARGREDEIRTMLAGALARRAELRR